MIEKLQEFYLQQDEPVKGTLLALRDIILRQDKDVVNTLSYGMPFFFYKGNRFCYLWFHKKYKQPYLGIVEGKQFDEWFLIEEKRSRMKIMLIDPNNDLPLTNLESILQKALSFCKNAEQKEPAKAGNQA